jgi:hypothetical protein
LQNNREVKNQSASIFKFGKRQFLVREKRRVNHSAVKLSDNREDDKPVATF